jgi:chromate transporter
MILPGPEAQPFSIYAGWLLHRTRGGIVAMAMLRIGSKALKNPVMGSLAAATSGAGLTTWCTFLPGSLFIFMGAPSIEALRGWTLLTCALSALVAMDVFLGLKFYNWDVVRVVLACGALGWAHGQLLG